MKGAVFTGDGNVVVVDLPRPEPGVQEALIEVKASGLCGSDLHSYHRPAAETLESERNRVRGHEACGVVAELGPGTRGLKVGDRVMVHHFRGCGHCKYCQSGWPQHCVNGRVTCGFTAPGGHENFLVCHDTACIRMPDELTFEEGACCACGTGTAYQALKRLAPSGMDTLTVFGQGPVGLSATLLASAMGARVIAIDIAAERLELSKRLGAAEIVDASRDDPVATIMDLTHGEGADATMDCTGAEVARVNTLKSARIWGRACFVGERGTATFEMTPQIIHKQLTIYGSWTFSTGVLAEVAQFVVGHGVRLKDSITHRFPLLQADDAYRVFATGRTGKVVLLP